MNTIQKKQVLAYYISYFSFGLVISSPGMALPFLASHAGVPIGTASLLFTMHSIGFLLGSVISGHLFDVVKGKYLLAIAWLIASISTFFLPLLSFFPLMCGVNMLFGVANSTVMTGCNTLITRVSEKHTSSLLAKMHVINGFGAFLTPIFFTLIIQKTNDIIISYHIYSLLFLAFAIMMIFVPPTVIKKEIKSDGSIPLKRNNIVVIVFLLGLISIMYAGTEISFNGWIYTFMKVKFPTFGGNSGYVSSAFWLSMTIGRIFFARMGRYYRVRNLMLFALVGSIFGLSVIALFDQSLLLVWIGTIMAGLFMGSVFPFIVNFSETSLGLSGKLGSVLFAGVSFGGMLMPYMNGQLFERISPRATMFSMTITITITLLLFLILYKKTPSKPKESQHIVMKTIDESRMVNKKVR